MYVIPLISKPSQTLTATINGQISQVNVYQKFFGLFFDLYLSNSLVIGGVVCQNLNRLVRSTYLGYSGDFVFFDTQGKDDPDYTGLGSRWQLLYMTPADLTKLGLTG